MCLALGRRNEGSELHCFGCKWSELCGMSIFLFAKFITTVYLPLSQIMTLVFTTIGPAADYRMFGRWLLLISTAICWVAQFASMSLTCGSQYSNRPEVCSNSMSSSTA